MELPKEFKSIKQNQIVDDGCLLFIPCKSVSNLHAYKRNAQSCSYQFNLLHSFHPPLKLSSSLIIMLLGLCTR